MVVVAVPVHPVTSVAVTVYVGVSLGDTMIDAEVSPVLHEYAEPPLAVKPTGAPEITTPSLAIPDASTTLMEGVGAATTLTVAVAVPVQPLAFDTVTV